MRKIFLKKVADLVIKYPGRILIVVFIITIIMMGFGGQLSMKNQFSDMMPQNIPQVQEYMKISNDFPNSSTVFIVVEDKKKRRKKMKEAAEIIVNSLKNLYTIEVSNKDELSFINKLKLVSGDFVKDAKYDTIPLVKRIDYKIDMDYIKQHGLMMQKTKDLKNMIDMYSSLSLDGLLGNINDNFEKEFVDDDENISSIDGKEQAIKGIENIYRFVKTIETYSGDSLIVNDAVDDLLFGDKYIFSSDNSLLMMQLQPNISSDDWDKTLLLGGQILDSLREINSRLDGISLHAAGISVMGYEEMQSTKNDMGYSSLIALAIILILLIASFGTLKNPFFSIVTLVVALIWVIGILAIVLGYLNMMSASFGIILIGLGIDFGIHFISGYRDGIEQGKSPTDAIYYMYDMVGKGVITGGLTTAVVFASLIATGFDAIMEMGIAVFIGIIVSLLMMSILLPTLIVWDNKGYSVVFKILEKMKLGFMEVRLKKISNFFGIFHMGNRGAGLFQMGFLEDVGNLISKKYVSISLLIFAVILTALSYKGASSLGFEYDMMKMQPKHSSAVATQKKIIDKFEMSPDMEMTTYKNIEDEREVISKLKKLANKYGQIGKLDGISEYIPLEKDQIKNVRAIKKFIAYIDTVSVSSTVDSMEVKRIYGELLRLHDNITEIGELSIMSDGEDSKVVRKCDNIVGKTDNDSKILSIVKNLKKKKNIEKLLSDYQKIMSVSLRKNLEKFSDTTHITVNNIDQKIKDRYFSNKDSLYILSIVPKANIWEQKYLSKFHNSVVKIVPNVTGTPSLTLIFINMIVKEGRFAIVLGFFAILFFLYIDFRSYKLVILAVIPLLFGAFWMVGLMAVVGMKFNYTNFMALPLILGIGIDDAVHILHRYKIEGRGSISRVLRFTGRAVLLTSITTGIGFGSMAFADHQGIASMGLVLAFGVLSCFLSSVIILPAIISLYELYRKNRVKGK